MRDYLGAFMPYTSHLGRILGDHDGFAEPAVDVHLVLARLQLVPLWSWLAPDNQQQSISEASDDQRLLYIFQECLRLIISNIANIVPVKSENPARIPDVKCENPEGSASAW